MRCHECERNRKERREGVSLALAGNGESSSTASKRFSKKGLTGAPEPFAWGTNRRIYLAAECVGRCRSGGPPRVEVELLLRSGCSRSQEELSGSQT